MLEQIYSDLSNLSHTLARYDKMLKALKEVAIQCNEISGEDFRSYQNICYQMQELQTTYEIIMLELQHLMQDKEG